VDIKFTKVFVWERKKARREKKSQRNFSTEGLREIRDKEAGKRRGFIIRLLQSLAYAKYLAASLG